MDCTDNISLNGADVATECHDTSDRREVRVV